MKREEVDVLSTLSNAAVIRAPGRNFPGVLVQGDSLSSLYASAVRALHALKQDDRVGCEEELVDVCDQIRWRLEHYEQVLGEAGLELPYAPRVGENPPFSSHAWPPVELDE